VKKPLFGENPQKAGEYSVIFVIMKGHRFMSQYFLLVCLLLVLFPVGSVFSLGKGELTNLKRIEIRNATPFSRIDYNREFVRPGFIGLISEEEERRISISLNPLINPQDPYTIRITSLDLVHRFYLGR